MATYNIYVNNCAVATRFEHLDALTEYNKRHGEQLRKGFFKLPVYATCNDEAIWGDTPEIQVFRKRCQAACEAEERMKTLDGVRDKFNDLYYQGETWKPLDHIYIDILQQIDFGETACELQAWAHAQATSPAKTPAEQAVFQELINDLAKVL